MRLAPLLCFLPLSACMAGDDYRLPHLAMPEAWRSVDGTQVEAVADGELRGRWWEAFNDETLNELVGLALENNHDLRIAEARLREARADLLGARAQLLPDLSLGGQASRGRQGLFSGNQLTNLYQAEFDAAWELDLFGGARREKEAAEALVSASEADREAVKLSLVAELARNYIDARNAQRQITLLRDNLKAQARTLHLIEDRRDAGLASDDELARADAQYRTTEARLPTAETALASALNRLNTLTGATPGTVDTLLEDMQPVPLPNQVRVLETPAASIMLRPDVARAERQLAAAASLHGAALANRYPKITLSGLLGKQNTTVLPATTVWSAGGQLIAPIIDSGRIRASIDAADARQQEALANYEKAVLLALEETETALAAYVNEDNRVTALEKAVASNRHAVKMADARYQSGVSAFIEVLEAERAALETESALAAAEADTAKNAVSLYKALGGIRVAAATSAAPPSPPTPSGSGDTGPDSPVPEAGVLLDSSPR